MINKKNTAKRINRYMLECKWQITKLQKWIELRINRYMLECK